MYKSIVKIGHIRSRKAYISDEVFRLQQSLELLLLCSHPGLLAFLESLFTESRVLTSFTCLWTQSYLETELAIVFKAALCNCTA